MDGEMDSRRDWLGEGVAVTEPEELLREKNGMPEEEGRRGLRSDERDLPGEVVTSCGGGAFPLAVSAVELLEVLSVLARLIMLELSLPADLPSDPPGGCAMELELVLLAKPAISLELAAILFQALVPLAWLPKLDRRSREVGLCKSW